MSDAVNEIGFSPSISPESTDGTGSGEATCAGVGDRVRHSAPRRRGRPRAAEFPVTVRIGKKSYRGTSWQIKDGFLTVKRDSTVTFISLSSCPIFEVIDERFVALANEYAAVISGAGPKTAGGPPGLRRRPSIEFPSDFNGDEDRNAALAALMNG